MTMQFIDLVICFLCFILPTYILSNQRNRRKHDYLRQKALILMAGTCFIYMVLLMIAIAKTTTVSAYIGGFQVWLSLLQVVSLWSFIAWIRMDKKEIKKRIDTHRKGFL